MRNARICISCFVLITNACSFKPQEHPLDPTGAQGLILSLLGAPVADLSGLVANYTFSGNSNDSVAGRNLTVGAGTPTLTADRFGVANSAYAFNGASHFTASDSIPSQLPSGGSPRTLCVWYRPTVLGSTVVQYGTGTSGNAFGVGNDAANQYLYTFTYQLSVLTPALVNTWTHFCVAYTGMTMMIYLDGTLASQSNASGASVNTVLSSLSVGKSNFQGDNFTGSIDDVRIYNRALNATDVSAVYAGQ